MAKDHVERLEQARKTLVERRRAMAGSLASAKEQIESEAERLMKIQGAIEAIDRALEDEQRLVPGAPPPA
jgi:DNA-binding FrmR family transcriptional regulator